MGEDTANATAEAPPQGQPAPGAPPPVPAQPPQAPSAAGQPAPAQYPPGYPPHGQPMPYQPPPGQPGYMPPAQPLYGQAPQPMYAQGGQAVYVQMPQKPVGYEHGTCMCGGDLGAEHWTILAWLLCIFFCPFNFCYPYCKPRARDCKQCGKTYNKP